MLRPALVRGDKGKVHIGGALCGELALGLLRRLLQALQGHVIATQIDTLLLLKFISNVIDQDLVKIISTEMSITIGGEDLEEPLVHLEDGNIKGTPTEIKDGHLLAGLLTLEPVGQRGSGRLVDNSLDLQAGNLTRILGGLALRVVEIGGHRDDCLLNLLTQVAFSCFLEVLQNDSRDLRRRVALAINLYLDQLIFPPTDRIGDHFLFTGDLCMAAPHETLDGENSTLGVGNRLALGGQANQSPLVGKGHHAGRDPVSICIGYDSGLLALHNRHD